MAPDKNTKWILVLAGFFSLALSFSFRSSLGIVMPVWQAELGWQRGFVAGIASIALVVMAFLAPAGGRLADRYGPRNLLIFGLVCCALGAALIALFPGRLVFILAFGGLSALGFSTVATHVVSTAISRAFLENRGLALGVATAGASAGQLLLLPGFGKIVESYDWRLGYGIFSVLAMGLAGAIVYYFPRQRAVSGDQSPAERDLPKLAKELPILLKSKVFHLLFWSFFICGFTTTGVIEVHFIPFAIACGVPPLDSAFAYGLLSAVNFLGMILAGYLTDRMDKPVLLGGIYIVRGLSFLLLLQFDISYQWILGFAVLFGLVDYSTVPVTAGLVASRLGLRVMGLVMGLIASGHALGAAFGSFVGGYVFDYSSRYDLLWVVAIGFSLLAGLLSLLIGTDRVWKEKQVYRLA